MTIRGKLISMAAVVLLVIATMAGFTYYRGDSLMRDQVNSAGMEIVKGAADIIDGKFDRIQGVVRTAAVSVQYAATQLGVSDDAGLQRIAVNLAQQTKSDGVLDIYIGNEATGRLSDGTGWKEPAGYDVRSRLWYKQAVQAGKDRVIFTDPFKSMITGNTVILAATTINDREGKLLGVVAGEMDIAAMNEFVVNLRIFGKGSGLMTLRNGLLAAYHIKEDVLKANITTDPKLPEAVRNIGKKMIAGNTGFESYTYQGEERQMFFAPTQRGYSLGVLFPVSEITAMVRGLTTILLAIAAVALVITGAVIFFIVRSLARSIGTMGTVTEKLGAGDLTVSYDDSGKDEIAQISRILNGMVASLREVMTSIRHEAEETSQRAETLASLSEESLSSMEEVSGAVEKVQSMAEQSSAALEETNASIEEIASSAQSAARTASDGAKEGTEVSEGTGHAVEEVSAVIEDIGKAEGESEKSIERIRALAKSVDDISGFVATITSIADQTNLLALNAAIEAARAGEAGRGFAVVAEEVRKLAEESARAAQEVDKLIEGLQRHSGDSITATETTGRILGETMKRASGTQEKLTEALAATKKMVEAIQSIAAVSEEQAASSEEMTSAVQSVTEATGNVVESVASIGSASRETTKAAESIAKEAQEMAATAEKLQKLVGRFVVDDSSNGLLPKK